MKLGELHKRLEELIQKYGSDLDARMIVEPKYDQALLDELKSYLDEHKEIDHVFQYETSVEDVAYSDHQKAIFFLPKDF